MFNKQKLIKMIKYISIIEKCVKSHENTLKTNHSVCGMRKDTQKYNIGFVDVFSAKNDSVTDLLLNVCKECPNDKYKLELAYNGERYVIVVREIDLR